MRGMKVKANRFVVLMVVLGLISMWGQAFAAGERTRISPVGGSGRGEKGACGGNGCQHASAEHDDERR